MGRCVSEQGYPETTIADVVRVARTSRTVFYKHFADKEQCFLETYQADDRRAHRGIAGRPPPRSPSWDGKLHAGHRRLLPLDGRAPGGRDHDRRRGALRRAPRAGGAQPRALGLDAHARGRGRCSPREAGVAGRARRGRVPSRSSSRPRPSCTSTRANGRLDAGRREDRPLCRQLARTLFAAASSRADRGLALAATSRAPRTSSRGTRRSPRTRPRARSRTA